MRFGSARPAKRHDEWGRVPEMIPAASPTECQKACICVMVCAFLVYVTTVTAIAAHPKRNKSPVSLERGFQVRDGILSVDWTRTKKLTHVLSMRGMERERIGICRELGLRAEFVHTLYRNGP